MRDKDVFLGEKMGSEPTTLSNNAADIFLAMKLHRIYGINSIFRHEQETMPNIKYVVSWDSLFPLGIRDKNDIFSKPVPRQISKYENKLPRAHNTHKSKVVTANKETSYGNGMTRVFTSFEEVDT